MSNFDLDNLLGRLNLNGWAMTDKGIKKEWCTELYEHASQLWDNELFTPGEIGKTTDSAWQPEVRGDWIHWIKPDSELAKHPFFQWMVELRDALNSDYRVNLRSHEFHFARYDDGHGYKKHIDQHRGTDNRKISVVLYLNSHWDASDGGELCLYDSKDPDTEIFRTAPIGGRLILFVSGAIPHEVLPSHRPRWSLTGWLRTDDPAA